MSRISQQISGDLRVAGWAGLMDGRRFLTVGDVPIDVGPRDLLDSDGLPLEDSDGARIQDSLALDLGAGGRVIEHIQDAPLQTWSIAWPYSERPGTVEVWDSRDQRVWPRIWWDPDQMMVRVRFAAPTTGVVTLFLRESPSNALN